MCWHRCCVRPPRWSVIRQAVEAALLWLAVAMLTAWLVGF